MMNKELDLGRLLRQQKEHHGLLRAMTSRAERRLARWQATNVILRDQSGALIPSSSDEGSTGSDLDFDQIY
jgi:hypothetical protein